VRPFHYAGRADHRSVASGLRCAKPNTRVQTRTEAARGFVWRVFYHCEAGQGSRKCSLGCEIERKNLRDARVLAGERPHGSITGGGGGAAVELREDSGYDRSVY